MAKRSGPGTPLDLSDAIAPAAPPLQIDESEEELTPSTRSALLRVALLLERNEEGLTFSDLRERLEMGSDDLRAVLQESLRVGALRRVGARTKTLYLLNPRPSQR